MGRAQSLQNTIPNKAFVLQGIKQIIKVWSFPLIQEEHPKFGFWACWAKKGPNWAKKGQNMGVAVPRAPMGGWSPRTLQNFGLGT